MIATPEHPPAPTHDAIAARAREIWESEGRRDGRDLEHWLRAEREVLGETAPSRPAPTPKKVRSRRKAAAATSGTS